MFDHVAKLATIPNEPGCYIMKNKQGAIVYIGKAKDLKTRVRNYFQSSGDSRKFVKRLPRVLSDIDFIVTPTEKDALILENTLIKKHKPRYNVQLKDDKNYISLRVNTKHDWPRVEVVRRRHKKDGVQYFGPYDSGHAVRRTLQVLNKFFNLRTCTDTTLYNRTRPCLQYQIKRCPAPCVLPIDRDDYLQHVQEAMMFLGGRAQELLNDLDAKMLVMSQDMNFEMAAHYRDQIKSVRAALERQQSITTSDVNQDVLGIYREGERVQIQAMIVRRGRLEGSRSFSFSDQIWDDEEILSNFLSAYYQREECFIPEEVLVPMELPESQVLSELLTDLRGAKVRVLVPQRGAKKALLDTAKTNAYHVFNDKHQKKDRAHELLEKLQDRLKLRNFPARMECYDISNFQGSPIVGSMVVFTQGEANKQAYRQYKMRDVTTQDDFASMHELLTRRLTRIIDVEDEEAPDLIVIDGGKGQLGQAVAVLEDLGLADTIDVIGLAKSRVDKVGFQDESVTRSPERIFLPGRKNPIIPKQNSAELFLLQRLRDEAHRSAIGFHKKLRRKEALRSSLDEVKGVGKQTKRDLLKHFGSLKAIKVASEEELCGVKGVGGRTAKAIYDHFNTPAT